MRRGPDKTVKEVFGLILNVPSTVFQLNRDGSSWVEPEASSIMRALSGARCTDARLYTL